MAPEAMVSGSRISEITVRRASILWGVLVAAIAVIAASAAPAAAEPPQGCVGRASVVYNECRVRHIYSCAGYDGVVMQDFRNGALERTWWFRHGFFYERRVTQTEDGVLAYQRRWTDAPDLAEALALAPASPPLSLRSTARFEHGHPQDRPFIETHSITDQGRTVLQLEGGDALVRVFHFRYETDRGAVGEHINWYAPHLRTFIGWRQTRSDWNVDTGPDATPRAILEPGAPGFLADRPPFGCGVS